MAIKILSKTKHNGKYYEAGEVIKKIGKNDEQRLIDLGVAISLESDEEKDKKNEQLNTLDDNQDEQEE